MNELLTMLDTKYKRLEYIQSTGTQYIDTGIIPNDNTDVEFMIKTAPSQVYASCLLGSRNNSSPYNRYGITACPFGYNFNSLRFDYSQEMYTGSYTFNLDTWYKFEIKNKSLLVNGVNIHTYTTTLSGNVNSLWYGANNIGNGTIDSPSEQKLGCLKIWQNGTLVRNFIPVLRKSDNELGMLDLVEGKFYGNAGTGKFTANLDTMYAIIQGSPTQSPYGVFSGFSASNYLQGSSTDKNLILQNYLTNFAFQVKVRLPNSISEEQQIIHIPYRSVLSGITIKTNGKILWYAMGSSNLITSITTFSFGTSIWIKGIINSSIATLYSSTDGINWITEGTVNSDNLEASATHPMRIGVNGATSVGSAFTGTIDLNRSYIKIDDTKYKLQAVVGYTKVGSPTITDGVVSGFSSANYLTLSKNIDLSQETVEFVFDIKMTSFANPGLNILSTDNMACQFFSSNQSYKMFNLGGVGSGSATKQFVLNTNYKIKLVITNNKLNMYYLENNNWILDVSFDVNYTTISNFVIGDNYTHSGTRAFTGTIDLNNTYMRINNKLWFNGLEA